jgi:hypothetical protein
MLSATEPKAGVVLGVKPTLAVELKVLAEK